MPLHVVNSIKIYKSWRKIAGIDKDPMRSYIGGETIMHAFWRSMCYDCTLEGASEPLRRANSGERYTYDKWWWNMLVRSSPLAREEVEKLLSFSQDQDILIFQVTVRDLHVERSFFQSSSGYVGFVPASAVVGDRTRVLSGGKTPFVLRLCRKESEDDNSHSLEYIFIGDAYVHGLMDGEAIDMVERGDLKMQTLVLN